MHANPVHANMKAGVTTLSDERRDLYANALEIIMDELAPVGIM